MGERRLAQEMMVAVKEGEEEGEFVLEVVVAG
jgi:hypothetical protein